MRILSHWTERPEPRVEYDAVVVPPIDPAEMIEDAFRPIARDGAGIVEVQIRLQKAMLALREVSPDVFDTPAAAMARDALSRSRAALEEAECRQLEAVGAGR